MVAVTARAYGRQLVSRPWASVLGWPALVIWAVFVGVALSWQVPAASVVAIGLYVGLAVVTYVVVMLIVAGATAAAIGLVLVVRPLRGRRTSYLLTSPAGKACLLVHGTDTSLWEATTLAAAPPHRGLATELGHAVMRDADAATATLQLWCTRSLERPYQQQGFRTARRRFGLRLMRRVPATELSSAKDKS